MRPVLALTVVLAAGCAPPAITLQFPDRASETESTELSVYAMIEGTDCAPLMTEGNPTTWVNSVTAKLPLTQPANLGRVAKGPAVFFAEARNAAMETILRGCDKGYSGNEILLTLHRVPVPVTMREGEQRDIELFAAVTLQAATILPAFATFDPATNLLHLAPGFADQGTHSITLTPTRSEPGTFTQRVAVTVTDVPRPLRWERLYRGFHGRFDAAALWDGVGKQLLTSGGRDRGVELASPALYTSSGAADVLSDYRALDLSGPVGNWGNRTVIRFGNTTKYGHVMGWLRTPRGDRRGFVLGGSDGAQVSPESLFLDPGVPATTTVTPSDLSGAPVFLTGMATAIEPDESRTYLFGGDLGLGTYYNDVRVVTTGTSDTSLVVTVVPVSTSGRPLPRTQAAMVMALNPRRLVVIGGRNTDMTPGLFNDVWVLCLEQSLPKCPAQQTWYRVINTGDPFPGPAADPSAGVFAMAAGYDAPRDRIVTYGGLGLVNNAAYLFEDTFELDLSSAAPDGGTTFGAPFRLLPPATDGGGLLGLVGAAGAYDADGGRLLLYGGITGRFLNGQGQLDLLEEVWSLGLTPGNEKLTMIPVTGLQPFPKRRGGAQITTRPPYLLFGGDGENGQPLDEWVVEGDGGVRQVTTPGMSPIPRATAGLVYNSDLDEHWLYGGRLMNLLPTAALFRLRADAGWSSIDEPLITDDGGIQTPRFAQTTVYDQVNKRMILFGGVGVAGLGMGGSLNDVKSIELVGGNLVTRDIVAGGTMPAPRYGAFGGYDRHAQRMLVFGGTANFGGSEADTRELWQLSLVKGAERWSKIVPVRGIEPDALYFPIGVVTRENPPVLYVLGSVTRPTLGQPRFVDQMWKMRLEPGNEEWIVLERPDFRPGPRLFATISYDDIGNRLLYAAGAFDPVFRNDVWALTLP